MALGCRRTLEATVRIRSALLVFAALIPPGALAAGEGSRSAPIVTGGQKLAPNSLRGVWKVSEQSTRSVGGAWSIGPVPYLSLYIFTDQHYSYMFAPGTGPRRLFAGDPNQPTDAEKVAAYDSFVAGSGIYALSGSVLKLTAILHKNPNEMMGEPLAYNVEFDGSRLVLTIVDPPFAPGRERRTVLTRIE
jgi:Lipocalin-like domain